jgi:myo-inositol-1-phosphate synthase
LKRFFESAGGLSGMAKIRVGLVGVGCCASSLVQGVHYYRNAEENGFVPGLMHVRLGKYHISDIEFSCAFDVDNNKVGKDLSEAVFAPINNTIKFSEVPPSGVKVSRGHTLDGLGKYYREVVSESPEAPCDVAKILKETRTDVLVNYLPVGSEEATKFYMNEAIKAGVGVVNCMPVFIASNPAWGKKFEKAGLPIPS